MATVLDVATAALVDLGVIAAGEVPSSEDASLCLLRFNRFVDQMAAERLAIYASVRTTWTITPSDGEYTVGSGGDVNIARPVFVDQVGFVDTSTSPNTEYPLQPLTEAQYRGIAQKSLTGTLPSAFYYNPTFTNARGTLTLWPAPTSSTLQGVIYVPTAVPEFASVSTTVSLPPGYKRFLETNLALELAPAFEKQPSPATVQAAAESKATVKRANQRITDLSFDRGALIGVGGGWYSIYTG